jgi:hypothetical protein
MAGETTQQQGFQPGFTRVLEMQQGFQPGFTKVLKIQQVFQSGFTRVFKTQQGFQSGFTRLLKTQQGFQSGFTRVLKSQQGFQPGSMRPGGQAWWKRWCKALVEAEAAGLHSDATPVRLWLDELRLSDGFTTKPLEVVVAAVRDRAGPLALPMLVRYSGESQREGLVRFYRFVWRGAIQNGS